MLYINSNKQKIDINHMVVRLHKSSIDVDLKK